MSATTRNDPEAGPDDRLAIANRIRELRRAQGRTLQSISEASRISLSHLSQVERAQSSVSGEKLARLAEALSTTADYILTGRGPPQGATPDALEIPDALAQAAEELHLSFAETRRLLEGKNSLAARRASSPEPEWDKQKWISFYHKVRDFL